MKYNKNYIGVIGERKTTPETYDIAYKVGQLIAQEKWILVSGGMSGIMEAACKGAVEKNGSTLGIIPGFSREEGNPYLTHSVVTGLFEARNSIVVRSCEIIIAIGGSYGTLSEIGFANVYGTPVVGLRSFKLQGDSLKLFFQIVETPEEAITSVKRILEIKR